MQQTFPPLHKPLVSVWELCPLRWSKFLSIHMKSRAQRLSYFPVEAQHSLFQVKGWHSWARTLIFMFLLSFCVSSLPSLQVSSLPLPITVPELAATTHSRIAEGKPATFHDLIQLVPLGLQALSNPHVGSALLLSWAPYPGTNPGQPWTRPKVTVHKG